MTESETDPGGASGTTGTRENRLRTLATPSVRYFGSRLLQGLAVIFGAVVISFLLIHITGNPAEVLTGGRFTAEQVQQLSERLGYDRPLLTQFLDYMGGVLRGDLGDSFRFQESLRRQEQASL